ncbi:MAG: sporulation protein YqfD [Oscillospiraceae bacterium]|nr:sporulation protein YqfD [Oscillospiraceae bacterium]
MDRMDRIAGVARIRARGAEPERFLSRALAQGLHLRKVRREDAFTVELTVPERELPELEGLCRETRCELELLGIKGGSRDRLLLRRRIALLVALAVTAGLLLTSSLFLWEIEIWGCGTVEEGRILRTLADQGVEIGAYWPSISPDLVRSRVLGRIPELAWMAVNISGSRAVVLVSERTERPEIIPEDRCADVVARCPGVVRSVRALSGDSRVLPGDAVLEGELLVSGSRESISGTPIQTRALAEVQADTWHELTAVCPLEALQETEKDRSQVHYALRFGKVRLDLPDIAGKRLDGCGMIVHEYKLGLKGLLALPVSLIREERQERSVTERMADRSEEMGAALLRRLEEQIRGEILDAHLSVGQADGLLIVTLRAHCCEDIAMTVERTP